MSTSIWFERELPIIKYLAMRANKEPMVLTSTGEISEAIGIPIDQVASACDFLSQEGYFDLQKVMGNTLNWHIHKLQSRLLVEAGDWPSANSIAESLIANLKKMESESLDPAKKSKIKSIIDAIGGTAGELGQKILVDVIAKSITGI